jgi:hypothetical protein
MGRQRRTISVVRELADRQHGVFARRQLVELGIGPHLIDHWLRRDQIDVVERGIYALSRKLLTREARWMAAVLGAGPDAVLSHLSAAAHWGIRSHRGPPEVTTARKIKKRPGRLPHCLPLAADEITIHDGIRITTPGRTLFDIAHELRPSDLNKAMRETEYQRLTAGPSLPELVARYPGRTGIAAVKRLLEEGWSDSPTRGELELRFSTFIHQHALPQPERNALIDLPGRRVEVDFLWRQPRVIVELDGYATHGTRQAFEDDRERDRLLQLAGFKVIRVTWRQVSRRSRQLARDLRSLLRS